MSKFKDPVVFVEEMFKVKLEPWETEVLRNLKPIEGKLVERSYFPSKLTKLR